MPVRIIQSQLAERRLKTQGVTQNALLIFRRYSGDVFQGNGRFQHEKLVFDEVTHVYSSILGNRLLLREQNFPLSLVVVNNLAQTSNEQNQRTHNKE